MTIPRIRAAAAAVLISAFAGYLLAAESPQRAVDFETEIVVKVRMPYLLYLPPDYQQRDAWPMIVFLHGAGERGNDLELVKKHGPPKIVESGRDLPFVILSPQCPDRRFWDAGAVAALVQDALGKYRVDPNRVYLTGLSMGGYGTWAAAASHARLFAAIAPICGGGDPQSADRIKHLPIWVFHGAKDETVPLARSQEMVDALKNVGADVRFTIYPEAGHDSWTATYDNPQLYEWFLTHTRKSP